MIGRPHVVETGLTAERRPDPPARRFTVADLARRRARSRAADELEASELRGDDASVRRAWRIVLRAIDAAEVRRVDPAGAAGGSAMDELRAQSLVDDALVRALADPGAWTSDDDEDEA